MSLFSRRKKEKVIGVIDIGSGSIGGAIVRITEDGGRRVEHVVRKQMVYQEKPTFERFIISAFANVEEVLKHLHKNATAKPDTFYYFLSSPWYVAEVKRTPKTYDKETLITRKSLNKIINDEAKSFLTDATINYADYLGDNVLILDVENQEVRLNGYTTANPFSKHAKTIDMSLYLSVANGDVLSGFEKRIHMLFPKVDIKARSFMVPFHEYVKKIRKKDSSMLLIDVSGEMTDISIIHENVIMAGIAFPIGKNNIVRRIALKLKTSDKDARSKFSLFTKDELTSTEKKRITSALDEIATEWTNAFIHAHNNATIEYSLPSNVYLVADELVLDWIARQIENKLSSGLPLNPQLQVTTLMGAAMESSITKETHSDIDAFLTIEADYIT